MRNNWEIKKLGEVFKTSSGGTPTSGNPLYYDGGIIPWLKSGELKTKYIYDTEQKITELAVDNSSAKLFPINTVVLAMYGATVGQVSILKIESTTNQAICGIFPHKNCQPDFLYYYLFSQKQKLCSLATGGAQPNISQQLIKGTLIPIPPLSEQQAIVEELDLLNGIIAKKNEQLAELDKLAQSTFYTMFGEREEIPRIRLGDICKTSSGGTPTSNKPEYYNDGIIPWLKSGEIKSMYIDHAEQYITELAVANSSAKLYPYNTVVIAMYGATVGQVGILRFETTTNQAVCGILPSDEIEPIYLYSFLKSQKDEYCKLAVGGAQPNISQQIIKSTNIPLPRLEEQQEFASRIEIIEKQKEMIKQSISETQQLLDATMQKYFG